MDDLSSEWRCYQLASSSEQSNKNWGDSLRIVCIIKTSPQLLFLLDELARVNITSFSDFNFFKNGIMPMWEDAANANGGRCIMEIPLNKKESVVNAWKVTSALCACDVFDTICGCVYNEKANYRISIWVSDPRDNEEIIRVWKELVDLPEASFSFSLHNRYTDLSKSKKRYSSRK